MKWKTAKNFIDATYHKSYDMDGYYGKQCWDYGEFFWLRQVKRDLSTGGTGCASGCWTNAIARKNNAGKDFSLITKKANLKVGDWVILGNKPYGHVAIIQEIDKKKNRYKLQGQNQGVKKTWVNRVWFNIDKDFLGAFRFKEWNKK